MNPLQTPQILLVGLPSTGKTSFLAALWHYIGAYIPNKKLKQYQFSTDDEYLNKIYHDWLNCKQPARTSSNDKSNTDIELFLEHTISGERLILNVPDVAGETFKQQWELRTWNKQYLKQVKNAAGLILFIHPLKLTTLTLLHKIYKLTDGEHSDSDNSTTEPWSPDKSTTQVMLVGLIQFHLLHFTRTPMPLALVISAWEKELESKLTPAKWLETNMPLLSQFLLANQERLDVNIYGISAQGGDFEEPEECDRLQNLSEEADRIKVQVDSEEPSNDITEPIQWLLSTWKNQATQ